MNFAFPSKSLPLALLGALVAVPACGDEEQSGDVAVEYRFGSRALSCADADVETVRVSLDEEVEVSAPCDGSGLIELPNVPAGTYRVLLVEGLDAEGVPIMDGSLQEVEVFGGRTRELEVRLSSTPARIRFDFIILTEEGAPYARVENWPVQAAEVIASRSEGSVDLATDRIVFAELDSFTNVLFDDPDKDINGSDLDTISVTLVPAMGVTLDEDNFVFILEEPPGPGRIVDITIRCEGTMCEEELENTNEPVDLEPGTGGNEADTGGETE